MMNPEAETKGETSLTEARRIQTLRSYCVLDTPREPAFDNLTALGAIVFEVPIVLISLVDEHRQFFKSVVGLPIHETGRDVSFCAYTILHDEPLVVLDAAVDERFRENQLVTDDPHIRFYAGAPLIDHNGVRLGSFCVIDPKPKDHFSLEQQEALQRFASITTMLIEQRLYPERIRRAEQDVLTMNERYRFATLATTEGIWDWNCITDELFKSAQMCAIVGKRAQDSYVRIEDWFQRVHPLDMASVRANAEAFREAATTVLVLEYRVRHEDGSWRWIRSRAIAIRDVNGHLVRVVGSLSDVTFQKMTDPLTGEHTRPFLMEALDRRIHTLWNPKRKFALLVLHFDVLKRLRSSMDGNSGDLLLIGIARRIRQTLSIELADFVARISRDEFAILVDYVTEDVDAVMYAELLQAVLQVPYEVNGHQISLTADIGIAVGTHSLLDPELLLQQAQTAAHEGGNVDRRCTVYSHGLRDKARRRLALTSDLRQAIAHETLALHYQPKVCLQTGAVVGFEALCRWQHPELGSIPPDEFIPIAEEDDLILELGRWALRESLRQLSEWHSTGLVSSSVVMAVNISARQFRDTQLVESISRTLARYNLPPYCLSLEVTEGTLIHDIAGTTHTLKRLKTLGVGLDLDDFGTGYSSLSYLQGFPFDYLKVDRSFVREMEQETGRATLVRSIIAMAHAMNLRVVAEGIETEEHLRLLCEMGCDVGQGYFFSRPLPSLYVPDILRDWRDLPSTARTRCRQPAGQAYRDANF